MGNPLLHQSGPGGGFNTGSLLWAAGEVPPITPFPSRSPRLLKPSVAEETIQSRGAPLDYALGGLERHLMSDLPNGIKGTKKCYW